MGDLNAGEDSDPLRTFFDRGYESAYRELHPGEQTGTFNGFRDPSGGRRIDHILLSSGLEPRRAEIVDGQIDGAWPSDHFAVTAVVSTSGGTQTLVDAEALSGLGYRYIGPPGNRTIAVTLIGDRCVPTIYLDGMRVSRHGDPASLSEFLTMSTFDVAVIEVYPGAASLPAEFNDPGTMCAIGIWTRRGGG